MWIQPELFTGRCGGRRLEAQVALQFLAWPARYVLQGIARAYGSLADLVLVLIVPRITFPQRDKL
jgi:hypothetical protein